MQRIALLLMAGFATAGFAQDQNPAPAPTPTPEPAGWEAALKAVTEACKGVTPQLCPGLSGETALACLQSNYDKLTPSCKDAVVKAAKSALNL